MNITDKQAVEAAEALRAYCSSFGDCCDNSCACVFNGYSCCIGDGRLPHGWDFPPIPAEPEPSEPDEPHLCKLFGVGVGERFDVLRRDGTIWLKDVWVSDVGLPFIDTGNGAVSLEVWGFSDIIEIAAKHPDRIRRKPKVMLTEVDKVNARACIADGLEWLTVDKDDDEVWLHKGKPALGEGGWYDSKQSVYGCPGFLFPWATHEGSPYYLPDLVGEEQA